MGRQMKSFHQPVFTNGIVFDPGSNPCLVVSLNPSLKFEVWSFNEFDDLVETMLAAEFGDFDAKVHGY